MAHVRRFIDVLNWHSLIAPGVMLCKDGSLLAGWRMKGLDTESMEEDVHASWLAHLSFALSGLGDDHTIWIVFRRSPWHSDNGDANVEVKECWEAVTNATATRSVSFTPRHSVRAACH